MSSESDQAGSQTAPSEALDDPLPPPPDTPMDEYHSEDSSLLPKSPLQTTQEDDVPDDPEEAVGADRSHEQASRRSWYQRRRYQALLALYGLALVSDLSKAVQDRPEFALVQLAVCRDYYLRARTDDDVYIPVDETMCRSDEVQVAVAELRARWSVIERVVRTFMSFI